MKKRIIAGFLTIAMLMALAACGGQKSSEPTKEAETEATEVTEAETDVQADAVPDDWYKAVLEDEKTKAEYPYYALADINLDGVDELFLSTTEKYFIGAEDKACLMAYVDGEPKTLQNIGGAGGEYWIPNKIDATLSYYSRLSGEAHIILYKLENGELTTVGTADSYGPHHYTEEDNDEDVYLIDGAKVSKEEIESYWEQYGNDAGAITYEKY